MQPSSAASIAALQKQIAQQQGLLGSITHRRAVALAVEHALYAQEQKLKAEVENERARLTHPSHTMIWPAVQNKGFPDRSSYQGTAPWPDVDAIGMFKLTEGTGYFDPTFAFNFEAVQKEAHSAISYIFWHPSVDAKQQIWFALNCLHQNGRKLRPLDCLTIDLEVTDGLSGAGVLASLRTAYAEIKKNIPNKVGQYSGGPFCNSLGQIEQICDFFHLAAYVTDPKPYYPTFLKGRAPLMWQHTDGVNGLGPYGYPGLPRCDMNFYLGRDLSPLNAR
jgi:GH25 family lysozyme M1 (1,4-beta-N-acetylmuramidase)